VVDLTAARLGLPVYDVNDVNLMTARKHFVGNARAGKSDIWHQCRRYGWRVDALDESDAI
jgi:hypothetical protein